MSQALQWVLNAPHLAVRQKKELLEAFTGWETSNKYAITDPNGQTVLMAGEVDRMIIAQFLGAARPFTIELRDASGGVAMRVVRPWRWFFPEATITDAGGAPIGRIVRRWTFFSKLYDLFDGQGNFVGQLEGPFFRPWTFIVKDPSGAEVGRIEKKFGGLLKEMVTDADTFGVQFGPQMPPPFRALLLGATFLVDFVHFESGPK
ncbi:MAG: hypothetical protein JNK72_16620 [Myxococcales bacterium]|nr:hypothetical protein [Myxococcales bacterium]